MKRHVMLVVAALLLASNAFAQDRLFFPYGEVGTNGHFAEVIGPAYPVLAYPRVAGQRYAVTDDAVVDLQSGASLPRPAGFIVAYDQARPRVFVSRDDGVWAVSVVNALEWPVFPHPQDRFAACRHAASADLLLCAYVRDDGQFDIYKSTGGTAVLLATLPMLDSAVIGTGESWVVAPDGTRSYLLECSRPSGDLCFGSRLVAVDVSSGAVDRAANDSSFAGRSPRLVLDDVRDRVFVSGEADTSVYAADLQLIGTAPFSGVNAWQDVAVSPHTDTVYLQNFAQSTYGSTSWLSSFRADSYAVRHGLTVLPGIGRGMQLLTAPGAPRDVAAEVSGHDVNVNWTNIGAASAFVIDIGLAPGRTDLSVFVGGGDPRASFSDVPPGTYYVRVRGGNLIGGGRASEEIAVTVQ